MSGNSSRFTLRLRRALVVALIALLALPLQSFQRAQAVQIPTLKKQVITEFDDIKRHLSSQVLSVIEGWKIKRLTVALEAAQKSFDADDACGSAQTLSELLKLAQSLAPEKRAAAYDDLFNQVWTLRQSVLGAQAEDEKSQGKRCQNADGFNREPQTEQQASDNRQFAATIKFGEPKLNTAIGDGETYTEVELPGLQVGTGEPGLPGVPVYRQLIAVPQGAKASVRAEATGARQFKLKLYPVQPEAADARKSDDDGEQRGPEEDFKNPPFTINKDAYAQDTPFPRSICTVTPIGKARGVEVAQLACAAGQYNAAKETLNLFDGVNVRVSFEGGDGVFTRRTQADNFETGNQLIAGAVLNQAAVAKYSRLDITIFRRLGEEFLILTHPDFRAAADRLAAWKNSKGIITRVVNVNNGATAGPDTPAQIDAYIENEYKYSLIRPSYILLMGDAEYIAPFYRNTSGSATTGTDYPYALLSSDGDNVPDFAVGRIPVDTLAQADVVVDKIINYEKTPPWNVNFYRDAAVASQFQCCRNGGSAGRDQRSFIETAEFARNTMLGAGKTADRIYTRTTESDYTGTDTTPRRYYNGTLLPAALGAGSGFAWSGNTTDIVNAFNAGRFLVLHRDHGSKSGFANPSFSSTNVTNDLHNGSLLPVVFSVNCASGLFDNETAGGDYSTTTGGVYFAERLLRQANGGAVGMLGDTRNSPTWANSALTRGFFDAVWPNALPSFGTSTSHRRLGDILNHGKLYLMTQTGVAGTTEAPSAWEVESELFLWHVIGDPTLEMWTSNPHVFHINPEILAQLTSHVWQLRVELPEETIITAFQEIDGGILPISRASVKDRVAALSVLNLPRPGVEVKFVANIENGPSVPLKVAQ